jgi:hypothetical protein
VTVERRRTAGEIVRDALALYGAGARAYLAISLAVVVPVDVIVLGIGLGELTAAFEARPSQGETLIALAVQYLVIAPLVTAMVVAAMRAPRPSGPAAIQAGLDAFAPVLLAVVLSAAIMVAGFFLFVVPGVIALVRLYFVAQAVVVDGCAGTEALRRSWRLTAGSFWRVLGIVVLLSLLAGVVAELISLPFEAGARAADREWISLAGTALAQVVVLPPLTIAGTLLFFDLRERARTPSGPAAV